MYFIFPLLLLCSCRPNFEKCEAFNLEKFPIPLENYCKIIKYTNEKDTLIFHKIKEVVDSQYVLDQLFNHPCNPYVNINYWNDEFDLGISYYFNYTPNEKDLEFSAFVDLNHIQTKIYTLKSKKLVFNEKLIGGYDVDSLRINRIMISNWKVTEFDYFRGDKWKIVK